jgi:hypothetical protein
VNFVLTSQTLGARWATPSGGSSVLDVVERSSDLIFTATSAATTQAFIVGNAVTYDGSTRIVIEFYCPFQNASATNELIANLWDGSTDLGRLGIWDNDGPVAVAATLTPSAASHTFLVHRLRHPL